MTELQGRQTTKYSSPRMPRHLWLEQKRQERQLWIAQHRQIGNLTLTGNERRAGRNYKFEAVCKCGTHTWSKWDDLKLDVDKPDRSCRSCALRLRMAKEKLTPEFAIRRKHMSEVARKNMLNLPLMGVVPRGHKDRAAYEQIYSRVVGAKGRCTNPNNAAYKNYGARGITFDFASVREAADWIYLNLGIPPSNGHSLDRIDNDKGYAKGNVRWATRVQQVNNRREQQLSETGKRIKALMADNPQYTYETIRSYVKKGLTDDEIRARKKWDGCGKYQRTTNL